MLIACQRMADQDRIAARGIELAIGLIRDLERREVEAAIKMERCVAAEHRDLRARLIGLARMSLHPG